MVTETHRRTWRVLGFSLLVVALPLAFLAATHPANEYKATLGIDALDCDGSSETYMLAALTLLIYGTGFIVSIRHWRRRWNLVVALCCLGIGIAAGTNYHRAMLEEQAHRFECQSD